MSYELFPSFHCIPNYTKHEMLTCFKKHISILEYAHHEESNVELAIANDFPGLTSYYPKHLCQSKCNTR